MIEARVGSGEDPPERVESWYLGRMADQELGT